MLFTIINNAEFNVSVDINPYKFGHYITEFSLYVNGKRVPIEVLSLDMDYKKTFVMGYRTLFEGSGIHHTNSELQITHDIYMNVYFMLLFDLTPDQRTSEAIGHARELQYRDRTAIQRNITRVNHVPAVP